MQRHLGTIGIVLGFVVLSIFAAFATSPGLMCRWTGYDCASPFKAISKPVAAPSEPANIGQEDETRERANAGYRATQIYTRRFLGRPHLAVVAGRGRKE